MPISKREVRKEGAGLILYIYMLQLDCFDLESLSQKNYQHIQFFKNHAYIISYSPISSISIMKNKDELNFQSCLLKAMYIIIKGIQRPKTSKINFGPFIFMKCVGVFLQIFHWALTNNLFGRRYLLLLEKHCILDCGHRILCEMYQHSNQPLLYHKN